MSRSLHPSTNILASTLALAAIASRRSVHAQSTNNDPYYYYYWLTPGRIVGIAIAVLALILLVLSLILLVCRHRRTTRAMASNFRQPQPYTSWQAQQPVHSSYPTQGPGSSDQAKSTAYSGRRTVPLGQASRTTPLGEVHRPAPTAPGQVQTTSPQAPDQGTVPIGQSQAPLTLPPRYARSEGTPSAGGLNAGDQNQNPPPYYPPSTPPVPEPAHTMRYGYASRASRT